MGVLHNKLRWECLCVTTSSEEDFIQTDWETEKKRVIMLLPSLPKACQPRTVTNTKHKVTAVEVGRRPQGGGEEWEGETMLYSVVSLLVRIKNTVFVSDYKIKDVFVHKQVREWEERGNNRSSFALFAPTILQVWRRCGPFGRQF